MTVIVAAASADAVWVGSDTGCQHGDIEATIGFKWHCGPRWAAALSGHARFNVGLRSALAAYDGDDPWALGTTIRAALIEDGHEMLKHNGEASDFDVNLLATDGQRIFRICRAFAAVQYPAFSAGGSGIEVALGAMHVSLAAGHDAERVAAWGLSASRALNHTVGGDFIVAKVTRDNGRVLVGSPRQIDAILAA